MAKGDPKKKTDPKKKKGSPSFTRKTVTTLTPKQKAAALTRLQAKTAAKKKATQKPTVTMTPKQRAAFKKKRGIDFQVSKKGGAYTIKPSGVTAGKKKKKR